MVVVYEIECYCVLGIGWMVFVCYFDLQCWVNGWEVGIGGDDGIYLGQVQVGGLCYDQGVDLFVFDYVQFVGFIGVGLLQCLFD